LQGFSQTPPDIMEDYKGIQWVDTDATVRTIVTKIEMLIFWKSDWGVLREQSQLRVHSALTDFQPYLFGWGWLGSNDMMRTMNTPM